MIAALRRGNSSKTPADTNALCLTRGFSQLYFRGIQSAFSQETLSYFQKTTIKGPSRMLCAKRDELLQLLIEAVQAYGDAVRTTTDHEGKLLKRTRERAEAAQGTYENYREAFVAHVLAHGCAPAKTMGASGS